MIYVLVPWVMPRIFIGSWQKKEREGVKGKTPKGEPD